MKKLLLGIFVLLIMNNCGGMRVESYVTAFHKITPSAKPTLYAFKPFSKQKNSLEYETYAGYINQELRKYNYIQTTPAKASVLVTFDYSIDNGRNVNYSVPVWGQTGISSSNTYATGNTYGTLNTYGNTARYSGNSSYSSTTTYTPSYGVTGYRTGSVVHYGRNLFLKIVDKNTHKVIYNGKVSSQGQSGQISAVMPYLVKSLFKDFPGKSGSSHKVTIQR